MTTRCSPPLCVAITTDLSEHRGELDDLHAEFDQVQADERKARALFETAATIADSDDLYGVFSHIARSAIEHLDFDEVTMYRADPEQGLLVGVVKAQAADLSPQGQSPQVTVPRPALGWNSGQPRASSIQPEPYEGQIKLVAGADPLADFVLSGETHRLLPADPGLSTLSVLGRESGGGSRKSELLVRVSPPGEDASLVGIIRATNLGSGEPGKETAPSPITLQQTGLLCALARLGSVANERARMERLRSQLIASVSHELRTPLAAIRAYNELLLDGDAGPINDEQHLFLSRIEFTSIQLGRILDDLLDLSRMRAGELSVRKGPTDVAACTQHIINIAQPEGSKKDISIESRIQPDLPVIVTDSDRLCQVLMNLVDNAVKYSHEGASVLVEARVTEGAPANAEYPSADGPELVISVADNGPGIPPGDLEKIFQEFHRGDAHAEHKPKGAGLGLAIVSRLVRLLGGTVSVDSTVGEGSTFYLRFPLEQMTGETPGTTVASSE
jgi:signal transduction histidine kinase